MDLTEKLQQQVESGAQSVAIPRSDALAIIDALHQREQAEIVVDTKFPPQQRKLFYAMRARLGQVFDRQELTTIAEIPPGGSDLSDPNYMAIWRLAKLVSRHLPDYRVASVTGAGWMLRKVDERNHDGTKHD